MTASDPRQIEWLPLGSLMDDPGNPKAHSDDLIDASMGKHGVIDLITRDDRTGYIVSGHGRRKALTAQHARGDAPPEGVRTTPDGTWLVPVVTGWASTDDLDAKAVLIKLNRLTELGGWVDESLLALLDELRDADRYEGIGFTDDDHAALDRFVNPPVGRTDPDDAPPLPSGDPVSQSGDAWTLGPHRLVVGDSTDSGTWDALLTGDGPVAAVWTDPPYGVDYVGKTDQALTIQGDGVAGLPALLTAALGHAYDRSAPGAAWYVAYADKVAAAVAFLNALHDLGVYRHSLVWVKDSMVLGRGDYHSRYEPIAYGWKPGAARLCPVADRTQTTVWEIPRPKRSTEHPTMKPVELVARALRNSTRPGDLVADPFGGSGSTLIACHQESRIGRLIELDPRYVDVICRRFQEHTGIIPTRDGEPHDFTSP